VSRRAPVEATLERAADHLVVRWSAGSAGGGCRFDHLPGTAPEWLGSADELLEGADRRTEGQVLDAVAALARDAGLELGIWHDDQGVELLS
jgi:hypothetical protein